MKEKDTVVQSVVLRPLDMLIPNPKNPRTATEEDIAALAESIKANPDYFDARPIVLSNRTGVMMIIDGEQRSKAAKLLGMTEVPTILIEGLTEEREDEIMVRGNTHAGKWSIEKLKNIAKEWGGEQRVRNWGVDLKNGWSIGKEYSEKLSNRFIANPFSVLQTSGFEWQERRRWWKSLMGGDLSVSREYTLAGEGNLVSGINGGTSNFDSVLAETMIKWFCPIDGKILDPFAGEPVKGYISGALGRKYIGVDIRPEQVELNREVCSQFKDVQFICGDSTQIESLSNDKCDFCLTSPPYFDLEIYSSRKEDLSSMSYIDFRRGMQNCWKGCYDLLKEDAFLVVKVGEVRDKKTGDYVNFVGDTITDLLNIGFKYYNELILVNAVGTAPLRANLTMKRRKVVKLHQNVLVFYKGDLEHILPRLENLAAPQGEILDKDFSLKSIFEPIYISFAEKNRPISFVGVPESLRDFLDVATGTNVEIMDGIEIHGGEVAGNNRVLLSYTGGKDSTVAAILLKELGYEVTLFFLRGLNSAFPEEYPRAKQIAAYLELPLITQDFGLRVKNSHPDNPVKNQYILSILADYASANGYGNISTGVIPVAQPNYDFDWSDGARQMQTFISFIESTFRGLSYIDVLAGRNEADNIEFIIKNHPDLLPLLSSCVGAWRYRGLWRKQIAERYHVIISDNCCGRCYKCAYQYIIQSSISGEYNADYLRYCFAVIKKNRTMMHQNVGDGDFELFTILFGQERAAKIYEIYRGL